MNTLNLCKLSPLTRHILLHEMHACLWRESQRLKTELGMYDPESKIRTEVREHIDACDETMDEIMRLLKGY